MKNVIVAGNAGIASLVARLVGEGAPGVRFAVVSGGPGRGVMTTTVAIARAVGLQALDMRLSQLAPGDLEDTAPRGEHYRKLLESMGDTLVVLDEADAIPKATLREAISFMAAQDVDRDDEPQMRLVVIKTHGPAADAIEQVRAATGKGPVGFVVLD